MRGGGGGGRVDMANREQRKNYTYIHNYTCCTVGQRGYSAGVGWCRVRRGEMETEAVRWTQRGDKGERVV